MSIYGKQAIVFQKQYSDIEDKVVMLQVSVNSITVEVKTVSPLGFKGNDLNNKINYLKVDAEKLRHEVSVTNNNVNKIVNDGSASIDESERSMFEGLNKQVDDLNRSIFKISNQLEETKTELINKNIWAALLDIISDVINVFNKVALISIKYVVIPVFKKLPQEIKKPAIGFFGNIQKLLTGGKPPKR
ncbi:hypothetical protein VB715_00555 [Crocosphaera sp. UHCC 0190]|uniref:hypothetical protein n=1 Tax=Crocosphaera sp. UHCC 0190 TaxID=3110246 RepID=UPI002B1F9C7C|nr:hypothetical protein [Crocosphaera sp. UHCC 0190]MEA5508245.1 hypothetical protein [Crocosphaera sp. UHCC 0190]